MLLRHDAKLIWQIGEERRRIDQTRMIRHIDIVLPRVEIIGAVHMNVGKDSPGDQATPPARTPVLHRARPIKRIDEQRDGCHHHGVEVPEQIRNWRPEVNQNCFQRRHWFAKL